MSLLTLLIILTVLAAILFFIGVGQDNPDIIGAGLVFLFLVGVIGWGLAGTILPHKEVTQRTEAKVLHDNNSCHLSVNDQIVLTYKDYVTVSFFKDKETASVNQIRKYNLYGTELPSGWELPSLK